MKEIIVNLKQVIESIAYTKAQIDTKLSEKLNTVYANRQSKNIVTDNSGTIVFEDKNNHSHGSITKDGKVGNVSGKILTTGTDGVVQASNSISKSLINDLPTPVTVDSTFNKDSTNPVQAKAIDAYIQNQFTEHTPDHEGHSPQKAKLTDIPIDNLYDAGYYQNNSSSLVTFKCDPDTISYKNAIIYNIKQSNHIIQYVYATSLSTATNTYKIDGRIYVRYGYTSKDSNNNTKGTWSKWYVHHIPYRKREDLIKSKGIGVNGFAIYETTGGYIFTWKQTGTNSPYILTSNQYTYGKICEFNKTLPIPNNYVVGNLIGHIDIKITQNDFQLRSVNKKNEVITGVDVSYFVPRIN